MLKSTKNDWRYNFARLKTWQERTSGYIAVLNFCMILFLYLQTSPLNIKWYWWVIVIGIAFPILIAFDIIFIFPSQNLYSAHKNPYLVEIMDRLDRIEKKLK